MLSSARPGHTFFESERYPMTAYICLCLGMALCFRHITAKQHIDKILLYNEEDSLMAAQDGFTSATQHLARLLLASRSPWEHNYEGVSLPDLDEIQHEWENKIFIGTSIDNACSTLPFFAEMAVLADADGADVILFSPVSKAICCDKNFAHAWALMLSRLGLRNVTVFNIPLSASNCWITRPIWMKKYLAFSLQAMQVIQFNSDIRRLLYTVSTHDGHLAYYPTYFHRIHEILPSLFFWLHSLKVHSVF